MDTVILPYITAYCLAVIATIILVAKSASWLGFIDSPNSRSSHKGLIPRIGGIGIFVPYILFGIIILLYSTTSPYDKVYWTVLTVVVVLGIIDDRFNIRARWKFLVQFSLAAYYIFASGNYIDSFHGLLGIQEVPETLGIIFSTFLMVFIINSVNLIDGVDGLCAAVSLLALFFFMDIMGGDHFVSFLFLSLGLIIFLWFNFSTKYKVFLGDAGSLGLGAVLAMLTLNLLFSGNGYAGRLDMNPMLVVFVILGYPIIDTLRVFIIRVYVGVSPFCADRRHIHHALLNLGFSHFEISLLIPTLTICAALINKYCIAFMNCNSALFFNGVLFFMLYLFIRHRSRYIQNWYRGRNQKATATAPSQMRKA